MVCHSNTSDTVRGLIGLEITIENVHVKAYVYSIKVQFEKINVILLAFLTSFGKEKM